MASRAAIKGGLNQDDAFNLSDYYIQRCEQLQSITPIQNLQYHMIIDYTKRVQHLKNDVNYSKLVVSAINYMHKNLVNIHSIDQISEAIFASRSYLSLVFKRETNQTLVSYLTKIKIEESKRLLKYTDRSLSAISNYLNFSSQSHFNNIFKKQVGLTPKNYRLSNN